MDDALSNPALIEAARQGHRDAQAALLRALQDPWYRMSMNLLGDPDVAREATQETAVRFLRQLAGFRSESQLRTWSLGIVLNVAREMRRAHRGWGRLEAESGRLFASGQDTLPQAAAELAEQGEHLRATLAGLTDRQREALVLRFYEDLSVEQTARAMCCAPGTVKATVHQALRALRQRLKQLV